MRHKKLIFIAICLGIFACWLIFSNGIIACFSSQNLLGKVDFDTLSTTSRGTYTFTLEIMDNITEEIRANGWAFCETNNSSEEKTIALVFKGEKEAYWIKGSAQRALDVNLAFEDQYQINGINHRYELGTSLINLPNGIYDLYLFCEENDKDTMLVNLMKRYMKKDSSFTATSYSPQVTIPEPSINKSVVDSLKENFTIESGLIKGIGWIFLEDQDTLYQNVYVTVYCDGKEDTYWAQSVGRQDVADYFDNPQYLYAGIQYGLPAEKYVGKTITMEAIVEIDGAYYTSGRTVEVQVPEA